MTETTLLSRQKEKVHRIGMSDALFGVFTLFCILLILRNSELAIDYITRGLRLCAITVIPSLFPFMVLSELLSGSGCLLHLPRPLLAPMRHLLGLPDAGCCAVLLGLLCGFPVGARCAISFYEAGALTQRQAERILLCASCPSSAFLISAVGVSLWGNRRFGLILYGTVLAVSLLCGIIDHLRCTGHESELCDEASPISSSGLRGAKLFCEAVRSSTSAMLQVCAYVVFFSAISGCFGICLSILQLPNGIHALLSCLLELSGGIGLASALPQISLGAALTAFAAGWSGISVHCQMLAVCDHHALSLRPYLVNKLIQGVLCAVIITVILLLFPNVMIPAAGVGGSGSM